MGTCAKIDQVSASVGRSVSVLWDFGLNQLSLEWIVFEHFKSFILGQKDSFVSLLLLSVFLDFLFDFLVVGLGKLLVAGK